MCRWLAYYGTRSGRGAPLRHGELPGRADSPRPAGGRASQRRRLRPRLVRRPPTPGAYRSIAPAWGDRNLRDLAGQIQSRLFLGHIRAATGTPDRADQLPSRSGTAAGCSSTTGSSTTTSVFAASCCSRRPRRLPRDRGHDRLGADVPPRADVRARRGAPDGAGAHGRLRRGRRRRTAWPSRCR